jgi:hypothetical protein
MWWKDAVARLPVDAGLTEGVYWRIVEQDVGVRGYTADQWQLSMEKHVPGGHIAPPFCITDWSFTLCMVARTDVCFNGAIPVAANACQVSSRQTQCFLGSVLSYVQSCT